MHAGATEERDGDYFGPPVNRVARLLSAGHGSQVLLSLAVQELVREQLPAGATLIDLGVHRLKDLFRPERIFQLTVPTLPTEFPPLRTLEGHPNNMPLQSTPLVGREREVEEVAHQMRTEDVRLLTLTGPGGTGKSRLALQAGSDLLEEFEDGVFFVALASITDPQLVPSTIAGPLGIKESAEQPLIEPLKRYLHDRNLLLIVDNFEQVLEGAPVVGELVGACPKLKVLATSRIPLRLYAEKEYPVPPLALPDPKTLSHPEILTKYEAVRLFVERARAVKADFSVTEENAAAVSEICARLDGLPLAIELAAARVRLLSPQAMLARLGNRLKLLRGGSRDVPARHQTLRGTIDWSYDLLTDEEKTLFERLSVFAGGSTLEAIEEVCNPGEDLEVLEGVDSLLEKCLLRREEEAGGKSRYVMLETVGEYAREKLKESGEAEAAQRTHAEHFLVVAEEAEPELFGPRDMEWFNRLEEEHDNMRAALSWALERAEAELALHLAGALWPFWETRGYYDEGRRWLEEALEKEGHASAASRTKALKAVGWLGHAQIDLDRAEVAAREGLKLSAEAELGGSLAASFQRMLGVAARSRGAYERATALFEESLPLSQEADDELGTVNSLLELGITVEYLDDRERAKGLYEDGILLAREFGYMSTLASLLFSRGYSLLLEGNYERAAALCEEAEALFRERGYKGHLEFVLDNLGWAALLGGDHERAKAYYEENLVVCKELGDKMIASESLEGLACVAETRGEAELAARLFGAAEALREAVGYQHMPEEDALREPYLAAASAQLDEAAWEKAWAEGRTMSMEQAIECALSELKPVTPSSPEQVQPSSDQPPSLTPREEEVAILVTRGLTNRRIASELFLSEHTVHHHVTNILKKLNLSSRQQVASHLPDR